MTPTTCTELDARFPVVQCACGSLRQYMKPCGNGVKGVQTMDPTVEWWNDPNNIADLIEWIRERGDWPGGRSAEGGCILELLRKPWHWDAEYTEMRKGEG